MAFGDGLLPGQGPCGDRVTVIGAPWCEGQNLEGADLAPIAMRDSGFFDAVQQLGLKMEDHGDIDFSVVAPDGHPLHNHHNSVELYREWLSSSASITTSFSTWVKAKKGTLTKHSASELLEPSKPMCLNVVNAELMGAGLKLVHDEVAKALEDTSGGAPPFVLTVGGDHSIATGTISALCHQHPTLGVVWVDAHGDANTPRTSPSGHYHGMPAAHLLGWFSKEGELGVGVASSVIPGFEWFPLTGCLPEHKLAYIGLRDVDVEEGRLLRQSGVCVFTMRDVDKYGIARCTEMAIEAVSGPAGSCPLHLSLDIDSIDPSIAPGTGTCARGGLSYREIHYICEELALTKRLVGMDLVEVNPGLDLGVQAEEEHMHGDNPMIKSPSPTVRLAVDLVLSALGKQIM